MSIKKLKELGRKFAFEELAKSFENPNGPYYDYRRFIKFVEENRSKE